MINNMVAKKSYSEVQNILTNVDRDIHVVEVDGEQIQTWDDYTLEIETQMKFPTTCVNTIDGHTDWLKDLEWLDKRGYVIIIYNFTLFMKDNKRIKDTILSILEDVATLWWQEEVEKYSAFGKKSPFNVYLVD